VEEDAVSPTRPTRAPLALTLAILGVAGPAPAPAAVGPPPAPPAVPATPANRPPSPVRYRPPTGAPVADPFRAPDGPYGAGNRGLEYAVPDGSPARAIGPGVVTFAGTVAGARWVTVLHPDGLRSSVGPLATVAVAAGDRVAAGQPLGTTGVRLHLGVRRGATYLDPAALFRRRRPRLVPTATVGGSTTAPRS
jgi:murein DD-endopeptidase MepM/ murein hydrolase activator NlpD